MFSISKFIVICIFKGRPEIMKKCISVLMLSYNHEKYIEESILSIISQDFPPHQMVIADDNSTDGTREILIEYKDKYPNLIRLILQKNNVGPAKNWIDLITAPTSKYIAYFEGDDFWIDPLKIKKQIEYLETNPEFVLTFHNAYEMHEGNKIEMVKNRVDSEIELSSIILKKVRIPSLSLVFRKDILSDYIHLFSEIKSGGDRHLVLLAGNAGKIHYFKDIMGVKNTLDSGELMRYRRNKYESMVNRYNSNLLIKGQLNGKNAAYMDLYLSKLARIIFKIFRKCTLGNIFYDIFLKK